MSMTRKKTDKLDNLKHLDITEMSKCENKPQRNVLSLYEM